MKSILQLLEKVESRFSKEYKTIRINGQRCFVSKGGTVFYFIVLTQFRSLIVEYANNIEEANSNMFEDGDQFEIDQGFETLIREIRDELTVEAA